MPFDPALQEFLKAGAIAPAARGDVPIAELRAQAHANMERSYLSLVAPGAEVASIADHAVAVNGGVIQARVYTPRAGGPLPVHD